MSNLIRATELHGRLGDPTLRVVDVRFDLADTSAGERAFAEGHIPGAVYAHLDRDLSGPPSTHGGRHPLPDVEDLAIRLAEMGIANGDEVVAYDSGSGMFASRLWWLLRYLGHDRVRVLDGGWNAWLAADLPVSTVLSTEESPPVMRRFEPAPRPWMVVDRQGVLGQLGNPDVLIVDSRAEERYSGESEPIDPRAGHIPSAVNLPFAANLQDGRFRSVDELRRRFQLLEAPRETIVYCGSGVSAAHNLLAMDEAGFDQLRLYAGSWSDWCSYADAPVASGSEN